MSKITKKSLIDKLRQKGFAVSRNDRKDLQKLMNLCSENGVDIEPKNSTMEFKQVFNGSENEPPKPPTRIEPVNEPVNEPVKEPDDLNEEDSMFEALKASRVEHTINQPVTEDNKPDIEININNDNETVKPRKRRTRKIKDEGFIVDGYILLMLIDMVMPFGLTFLFNMFISNPKKKIQPHEIGLSDEQRTKLEPLADRAAEAITIKMNPLTGFFIMSSITYGSNLLNVSHSKSQLK